MIGEIGELIAGVGVIGATTLVAYRAKEKIVKAKDIVVEADAVFTELDLAVEEFKRYSADGKWDKDEVDKYFDRVQSITIRGITIKEKMEGF